MCALIGDIPKVPESPNIIYSNPYKPPEYKLNGFKIDYEDFHVEAKNNDDQNLQENKELEAKELEELEQKYSKIQELIRLKTLEKDSQQIKKISDERSMIKKDLDSIKKSTDELLSYATDLTSLLFNYQESKLDDLYNELASIVGQDELELSGEDENIRCEKIMNVLSSIKATRPRKKAAKHPKKKSKK